MFAIFFHESMTPFHQTVTSFPTVIYSVLVVVCILYWLIAVLGFVDLEILDLDMDGDIDSADSADAQSSIAGLLHKLGLNGVPLTVILTILTTIGWLSCYYTIYLGGYLIPEFWPIKLACNIAIFITATIFSTLLTAQVIKPI